MSSLLDWGAPGRGLRVVILMIIRGIMTLERAMRYVA